MIIPLGTEASEGRIYWGSASIMLVCVLLFLATTGRQNRIDEQVVDWASGKAVAALRQKWVDSVQLAQGDTTTAPSALSTAVDENGSSPDDPEARSPLDILKTVSAHFDHAQLAGEPNWDSLAQFKIRALRSKGPFMEMGMLPSLWYHPARLLLHQFLHSGWLHLLGNLLFFYLCAMALEAHWGFARFLVLYLGGGIFAAWFYAAITTYFGPGGIEVPMVGASGAIAGLMGAFLVIFGRKKIHVVYIFGFLPRMGRIPAWVFFGMWFLGELVHALVYTGRQTGGTAYAAHVGGFLFGLGAGWLVKGEEHRLDALHRERKGQRDLGASLVQSAAGTSSPLHAPPPDIYRAFQQWEAGQTESARLQFIALFDRWSRDPTSLRDWLDAIDRLTRTQARPEIDAARWFDWGNSLGRIKQWSAAIYCLQGALESTSPLPPRLAVRCKFQLAKLYQALGYSSEHIRPLLEAVSVDPEAGLLVEESLQILSTLEG